MLILSRKESEVIVIGERGPNQIKLTVVLIDRGKVRLGIDCPKAIQIFRSELLVRPCPTCKRPVAPGQPCGHC